MIKELTEQQKSKIPEYRQRWIDNGRRTDRIDRAKAEQGIRWLYAYSKRKPPEIIWAESPREARRLARENDCETDGFFAPPLEPHWVCLYEYLLKEVLPDKQAEFRTFLDDCIPFYQNVFFMLSYETICYACERPIRFAHDENGNLHNSDGPAIEFSDGYGVYALDNVRIRKEMLEYNGPQIMAVKNVEQRLVLIRNFGAGNMLEELGGKLIDEDVIRLYGQDIDYKLWAVQIEGNTEKLLEMQNPSEPKRHHEFVTPGIMTCKDALAERMGMDKFKQPKLMA